ncbi:hypothetical protein SRHO_G00279440 [Serrasalmus rhombeus]
MELIPEMLTHPTLDDTARHFFSSESAGIPARHMKLIPVMLTIVLPSIRKLQKPENPEETHADTRRTCKLHTERTRPGNRTQALLAVRRQRYPPRHRAVHIW